MFECANCDAQGLRSLIDNRVLCGRGHSRRRWLSGLFWAGTSVPGCFGIWLRNDCFECTPLRIHADVGVMLQHLLRNVASNVPYGFVPGAALGKVGDEGVPVIVPAAGHASVREKKSRRRKLSVRLCVM